MTRLSIALAAVVALGLLVACGQPAGTAQPAPTALPPTATPAPATATPAVVVLQSTSTATAQPTATLQPTQAPTDTPTVTPLPPPATPSPTATPLPTATPSAPAVLAARGVNVRAGPGTVYAVIGGLAAGDSLPIVGRNAAGDWWQICCLNQREGWVAASVVETQGLLEGIGVAANIPPPPPTATPAPVVVQPTAPPAPPPASGGPQYVIVEQRPLSVTENGGYLDGESVHCGYNHVAYVLVVDAGGAPINGAVVAGQYNMDLPQATGSKGPGRAEFVTWGNGDNLRVVRNPDGSDASSETSIATSTEPHSIPMSLLIAGGYCRDEAHCQAELSRNICKGHFSWQVTFRKVR